MKTRHAVILAAGGGTRLRPFTDSRPKCLAEVGGRPILLNALQSLADSGVETVRVVVGHFGNVVRVTVGTRFEGMRVEYVENEIFARTNSMYSLMLGLDGVAEATWVVEGDVFFDPRLLKVPTPGDISWLLDSARRDLDGAYITYDADGRAMSLDIVRNLELLQSKQAKSTGMLHLSAAGVEKVRRWLDAGIQAGKENLYYDLILGPEFPTSVVHAVDVNGAPWFEIDTPEDLRKATALFAA